MALEDGLERSLRRLGLTGRTVLVAVSGGPDSMTLLSGVARVATRLGLSVLAATVDHSLRESSAREAATVGAWAGGVGVGHRVLPAPVAAGAGAEAAARAARYAALEAERARVDADAVLTGHTANDQAETVLMRLARGAALRGAAGIVARREDRVARPLLFVTRAEVLAYVEALQLPVLDDEMNRDERLLRTRVREGALPALEQAAGAGTVRALARFAALAADDEAWLERQAAEASAALVAPDGTFDAAGLSGLPSPLARRALGRWLEAQGVPLDSALLEDGLSGLAAGRTTTLPGDRLLTCENGRARVVAAPPRRLHSTSSGTPGRSRG